MDTIKQYLSNLGAIGDKPTDSDFENLEKQTVKETFQGFLLELDFRQVVDKRRVQEILGKVMARLDNETEG